VIFVVAECQRDTLSTPSLVLGTLHSDSAYAVFVGIGLYGARFTLFLRDSFQEEVNNLICRHIFCFGLEVEETTVT